MATAKKAQANEDQSHFDWEAVQTQLDLGSGPVLFIKDKTIRVRLVPVDNPKELFWPVNTYYREQKKVKYLVKVALANIDPGEDGRIRCLLITPTLARQIVNQAKEGWDLFSMDKGAALAIKKEEGSGRTNYVVLPSPEPMPLVESDIAQAAEVDMESIVADFNANQLARLQSGQEQGKNGSKPKSQGDWS